MATVQEKRRTNGRTSTRMFKTHNDLPEDVRDQMVTLLNQQLADTTDLYTQTKQAHWNVRGPEFFQLHELFDQIAEAVESYTDLIAERATALGGEAAGTVRMAAQSSRIPEYPTGLRRGLQHVEALVERYGNYAASTRKAIDEATEAGDDGTADMFTEISRGIDKHLWFLEAHLQSD
jgi:starvation-inducible DNA-binding protein